ncbi:putative inactive peptidyl-prolyl cis-trans isomerase-like 6 [Morus bassanus]
MGPRRVAVTVTVVGLLRDPAFHVAKCVAEALKLKFPSKFADPVIQPLVEFAWHEYLQEKKKELRGEVWAYASSVMCFIGGQLLGDEKELLKWSYREWDYRNFKPEALYQAIAEDFYTKYLKNSQHVFVYLDIAIEEQRVGRLLFELFSDACPRTCENFRALCSGGAKSPRDGRELTYKNSLFHRLVRNGWIQGGDIITGKGDGGESIYGPTFEDAEEPTCEEKPLAPRGPRTDGAKPGWTQVASPLCPAKSQCWRAGKLLEMKASPSVTREEGSSGWPTRAATATARSSTSPSSQLPTWTKNTWLLGRYAQACCHCSAPEVALAPQDIAAREKVSVKSLRQLQHGCLLPGEGWISQI